MRLLGPEDREERCAVPSRAGQPVTHDLAAGVGEPEALDDLLALALIIGSEHEAASALGDHPIAHIREALACEAELHVVLAALADVELGLGAHERAALDRCHSS